MSEATKKKQSDPQFPSTYLYFDRQLKKHPAVELAIVYRVPMPSPFDNFTAQRICHLGVERDVYSAGEGPIVLLLHESPNPFPEVFTLGNVLAKEGYQVHIPVFSGKANQPFSRRDAVSNLVLNCIRREFAVFAAGRSSPLTDWIREFCRDLLREQGQEGIGLIGMCLTGNFALSLLAEPWMLAPVLSQPSLPYGIGPLAKGLHVDQETIDKAKKRDDLKILGLRFTHDFLCPRSRFDKLRNTFGTAFQGIEINSGPFNSHGIPLTAHSVLTKDFVNEAGHPTHEALRTTLSFLESRLKSVGI
jgi:dienelactone hydrolase